MLQMEQNMFANKICSRTKKKVQMGIKNLREQNLFHSTVTKEQKMFAMAMNLKWLYRAQLDLLRPIVVLYDLLWSCIILYGIV